VCPSRQCSSAQFGFGQGFLCREQCDNTGASPILSWPDSSCFLPTLSNAISIKEAALLWCYWNHDECDGRAEKVFTKWLPGMFPAPLQLLVEAYCCIRGLFWKKCGLSDCADLYVSEIKWFRKYYEATTYYLAVQMCVKKRTL